MDLNNLLNMATNAFDKNGDGRVETGELMGALGSLLSNGQSDESASPTQGGFDLSALVSKMQQGGLGEIVQSWLGDGANQPVSGEQLQSVLGQDQIAAFAQKTGLDLNQALASLQQLIPNLVDKSSQGGQLLASNETNPNDLAGMIGNLASNFLKR